MTGERPLRETYDDYRKGRISFEELKREIDRAADEFEKSRGRTDAVEPRSAP